MRALIATIASGAIILWLAGAAHAHGGFYGGPGGAGTSGGFAPGGSGTPGPGGDPNGGGTTGGRGQGNGGTTGTGGKIGGSTGPRGSGNGGGLSGNGGVPGLSGGVSGGRKKASGGMRWDDWWYMNDERFLRLKAKLRAREIETTNPDLFVGADRATAAGGRVAERRVRNDILPRLRAAGGDSFYDVRAAAVIALGKCGEEDARVDILAALDDEDAVVRESACLALGIHGSAKSLGVLEAIARDDASGRKLLGLGGREIEVRTRVFAAIAIGLIGDRQSGLDEDGSALATLRALASPRADARAAQDDLTVGPVIALGICRSPAVVPDLLGVVADERRAPAIRSHAATSLGKLGDRAAIRGLIEALGDKQSVVRQSAAIALGRLLRSDDREVARLVRAAEREKDTAARRFAIMALGRVGGETAHDALHRLLDDGNTEIRPFAALALGASYHERPLAPFREETGKLVLKQFRNAASPESRGGFAIALGLLRHAGASEDLLAVLRKEGSEKLRTHACVALGLMECRAAIPLVRAALDEPGREDLRRYAAISLGLLGDRDAIEILRTELASEHKSLAELGSITRGLGFIGDASVVAPLGEMATDHVAYQDATRAFAAVALGLLGDKDELPMLSRIAEDTNFMAAGAALSELLSLL
ncbi:MAG: HEAT repeat domain-containing protein [Planctomycetota bacterium]